MHWNQLNKGQKLWPILYILASFIFMIKEYYSSFLLFTSFQFDGSLISLGCFCCSERQILATLETEHTWTYLCVKCSCCFLKASTHSGVLHSTEVRTYLRRIQRGLEVNICQTCQRNDNFFMTVYSVLYNMSGDVCNTNHCLCSEQSVAKMRRATGALCAVAALVVMKRGAPN